MPRGYIPPSLRKEDFTDRDLVCILHDCINDSDGYAHIEDVVLLLGGTEEDTHLRRCVAARFSVMARGDLKLTKRHPQDRKFWKLTARGNALRTGALKRGVEQALSKMDENEQVILATEVTRRSIIDGSASAAMMTRRVVDYSIAHRKNGRRSRR